MYRLVRFFRKYYVLLLFLLLEAGAISYYSRATSYSRATLLAASARVTGAVHGALASVGDYFSLGRTNRALCDRIAELETELHTLRGAADDVSADTIRAPYLFTSARVVSNSIARQDNYFVIDRGAAAGVRENMAVLTPEGAVAGFVRTVSPRYAVCMSTLNREFRLGGRLKGTEYFGSIYWDGTDSREMVMTDIPRYADAAPGDTLVVAYSSRFPTDSFIGTVSSLKISEDGTSHVMRIRLGARMNALREVLVVDFADHDELGGTAGHAFADTPDDRR